MHSISGTNITLTRGDSLFLELKLYKNDEEFVPDEGSSIRFAMKQKYSDPDEAVILIKSVPLDTLVIEFKPEDTKDLKMKKSYVYDIELTDPAGHVDTFIGGTFTIAEEVI